MAIRIQTPAGQEFDITVASGGTTRRQRNTGGSAKPAQTLTINVYRSNTQIAPEVIGFEAVPSNGLFEVPASITDYDETVHSAQYEWDFGDPGSQHVSSDLTAKQRDANRAYGKDVTHYYTSDGTYTVTCTITWPGTSYDPVVQTVEVTIAATESAFASGDINYIDPDSDYTDAPVGARTFNDIDTFMSNYDSGDYTTPQLVYLSRGKTHSWGTQHTLRTTNPTLYIMSDPNNAGAKAIVTTTRTSGNLVLTDATTDPDNTRDFAFHDIQFDGPWDSETETGGRVMVYNQTNGFNNGASYFQCTACDFSGWEVSLNINPARNFSVANNTVTNWQDYGMYIQSQFRGNMVGNTIKQSVNAIGGGPKEDPGYNNHGPVRHVQGRHLVVIGNHFHSGNGWFVNSVGYQSPQPCFRSFMNGQGGINDGARFNFSDNIFEGGGFEPMLAHAKQDSGKIGTKMNGVIERNIFVAMFFTKHCVASLHGGTTIRNNLFCLPDVPTLNSGSLSPGTPVNFDDPETENADSPQRVYGNTAINLMSSANDSGPSVSMVSGASNFSDVSSFENFVHQPNLDTPDTPYTNIDDTTLFTPRYAGYRSRYLRYTSTFEAENGSSSVANLASFTIPYTSINGSLTQADVDETPANPSQLTHELTDGDLYIVSSGLNVAFAFDASGVTITNNTGGTLSGTFTLHLLTDNDSFINTLTEFATPSDTAWSGRPLAGSTIANTGSAMDGWDDFNERSRGPLHAVGAQEI